MKTIAVKESTLQVLSEIKERLKAQSLDETIVKIIQEVDAIPKSRFGKQPKLKKFKRGERSKFHDL